MLLKNQSMKLCCFVMLVIGCYCLTISQDKHMKLKNNDLNAFRKAELRKHNSLRKLHGTKPLKLDSELNQYAQQYAQELASDDKFEHSNGPYGQNLYMISGSSQNYPNGAATQAWYDEISVYDWENPGFSMETGHFTQVVWKGTTKVGFGYAQSQSGAEYVVAEYDPPGNYEGEYEDNVLPN